MDAITGARIAGLMDEIHNQKKRLDKLERSTDLTHSAIDTGGIVIKDAEGNERVRIGQTESGVVTTQYKDGPVPNQPSTPVLDFQVGAFNVTWDGMDAAGNRAPDDFKALNIYASTEPDFEANAGTFVGVIPTAEGGTKTVALPYGTYYVRTALHTLSGQTGPVSEVVSGNILSVVELPDVADSFAQGREDMKTLDGKLTQAQTDLQTATERLDTAESILNPLPGELDAVRQEAADAVTAAEQAQQEALAAQTAATEANARAMTVLPNGSFEDDLKYWEPLPGKTAPQITTDAYVESKAAHFGNNTGIKSTVNIPVVPGHIWELSAYYRNTTGIAANGGIKLEFADAQGVLPSEIRSESTPDISTLR